MRLLDRRTSFLLAGVALLAIGCSQSKDSADKAPSQQSMGSSAGSSGATVPSTVPGTSTDSGETSTTTPKNDKATLAALEKDQVAAKKALAAKPGDADLQKKCVETTLSLAHATETSPDLDNKLKYKKAYLLYLSVLKIDPKNQTATDAVSMYRDIYKSLNRPVPKEGDQ